MNLDLRIFLVALLLSPLLLWGAEDEGPLAAAKEPMGKLVALTVREGRLVLDRESWDKTREKEPEDPEEHKKWLKQKIAKKQGISVEQVDDTWLEHFGISNRVEVALWEEVMSAGGGQQGGSGSSSGDNEWSNHASLGNLTGRISGQTAQHLIEFTFTELTGSKRRLDVGEDELTGLTVRLVDPQAKTSVLLAQSTEGPASLVGFLGGNPVAVGASSFDELLIAAPEKVQRVLLHPLADLGIVLPPCPHLPTVMALVTSGYGPPAPEVRAQADAWLAKLRSEEVEVRQEATRNLTSLYPLAIQYLEQAQASAQDEETKFCLGKASAAHPGIARARPYVEEKKLQDDKAYLLDLMTRVPFFRAGARTRLAALLGKDYGDDPAAWPK